MSSTCSRPPYNVTSSTSSQFVSIKRTRLQHSAQPKPSRPQRKKRLSSTDPRHVNTLVNPTHDEDDALSEVIVALDLRNRETVGCCYYVAREAKLWFLPDVKLGGLETIQIRKLYWRLSATW